MARQESLFVFGWHFHLGDLDSVNALGNGTEGYRPVQLPHDWSVEYPFDQDALTYGSGGYVKAGIGWYKKIFTVPDTSRGSKTVIRFDGAYMMSEVWLNGKYCGTHVYGYTPFEYDITELINYGGENVLAVKIDNSVQPNSRWYTGSGIVRDVWMLTLSPAHIGSYGVFVRTPEINKRQASVEVVTTVNCGTRENVTLRTEIIAPDGKMAALSETVLSPGGQKETVQRMSVSEPRLWSVDTPHLYRCVSIVLDGDSRLDRVETPFGIRSIRFDANDGFILNGNRVKINGFCVHHDGGSVGAAVPRKIWERRLRVMKEMGANGLRAAHNPPDPALLDLCDEMGFLVMDEAFDEWRILKSKALGSNTHESQGYSQYFDGNYRADIEAMLLRDRNHPSIVIWSIGNEVPDQTHPQGHLLARELQAICHSFDPTRPVTQANDQIAAEPKAASSEFLNELDVVGYNYAGRWRERAETLYDDDKRSHPDWIMIGTENSSIGGKRGVYGFGEKISEWRKPYFSAPAVVGKLLKFTMVHDYVCGDFMWTGIDHLGEAHWPDRSSNSGVLDTCGFPKDGYYFYKSIWNREDPMVHLVPHWNLEMETGAILPVICYTNCEYAELFLNGKSYGRKSYAFPAYGMTEIYAHYDKPPRSVNTDDLFLCWDVPYQPGVIEAVGYIDGKEACRETVRTAGEAARIEASADSRVLTADGRDICHVEIRLTDVNGNFAVHADNSLKVEVTGAAKLIGLDNGKSDSIELMKGYSMRAFGGMLLAIIQSDGSAGEVRVRIAGESIGEAVVRLEAREVIN